MDRQWGGLRVMVSAGGSGIGLAIAQAFVAEGACVEVSDISEAALSAARAAGLGTFEADVSDPDAVEAWFGHALGVLGGLDVLVNNAGIAGPTARIEDVTPPQWDQTIAVNLRSQYLCTRQAIAHLRRSKRASIISISSVAGRVGYPLRTPYASSKWAVIGLTQSLAIELGEDDITVNAILPGIVDSQRSRDVTRAKARARGIGEREMEAEILGNVALRRMVPLADVAQAALFLASRAARSITGESLNVCAGISSLR